MEPVIPFQFSMWQFWMSSDGAEPVLQGFSPSTYLYTGQLLLLPNSILFISFLPYNMYLFAVHEIRKLALLLYFLVTYFLLSSLDRNPYWRTWFESLLSFSTYSLLTNLPKHRAPAAMARIAHRKALTSPHLSVRKPKRRGEEVHYLSPRSKRCHKWIKNQRAKVRL